MRTQIVDTHDRLVNKHVQSHRSAYILLGLVVLLNLPVFRDLIKDWGHDPNYSHGFLVIPVALWLFWRNRRQLIFPARPSGVGLIVFAAGCLGLIMAVAASEYFTTRLALLMIFTGISLFYLGTENFRKVWFPFFFLLFMIPIPAIIYNALTLPMQLFATRATVAMLHLVGVTCERQGNVIQLPGYSLAVEEACSGLRSLVALMAMGALYAYLFVPGTRRSLLLFASTVPIAIVTNVVRIFATAVAAYAISTKFAEDFLHELSGMVVFGVALVLILVLGALLRWRRKASF